MVVKKNCLSGGKTRQSGGWGRPLTSVGRILPFVTEILQLTQSKTSSIVTLRVEEVFFYSHFTILISKSVFKTNALFIANFHHSVKILCIMLCIV